MMKYSPASEVSWLSSHVAYAVEGGILCEVYHQVPPLPFLPFTTAIPYSKVQNMLWYNNHNNSI